MQQLWMHTFDNSGGGGGIEFSKNYGKGVHDIVKKCQRGQQGLVNYQGVLFYNPLTLSNPPPLSKTIFSVMHDNRVSPEAKYFKFSSP